VSNRASIVIPTFQRRASVLRTLEALGQQTAPADCFEVIVSIDGSTDGTAQMVETFVAPYRLRAVTNLRRGRAAACNAGIRAAENEVVVLLDDDMEPAPDLVAAHLYAHRGSCSRGVVGAAPMVVPEGASPLVKYRARGFNGRLAQFAAMRRPLRFREAYTGHFSIHRDVLMAAGGFDEGFTMYGHEDYELALRLVNAGVELVYSPAAVAFQHYEKTFAAFARDCIERGHTALLFAAKHPEAAPYLEVCGYRRPAWQRRLLRSLLLTLTGIVDSTPHRVVAAITWLERLEPRILNRCYDMGVDYFYWLGVSRARAAACHVQPVQEHAR
jgi:GT2 family glycosyltransferase